MGPDYPVRYRLELKATVGQSKVEVTVFKSLGDHFVSEGHQPYSSVDTLIESLRPLDVHDPGMPSPENILNELRTRGVCQLFVSLRGLQAQRIFGSTQVGAQVSAH